MNASESICLQDVVVEHRVVSGAVRALDGVSLTVDRGSSLAVLGPSGGGKSTLLGIMGGFARPTRGTVRIGDLELSGLSERDLSDFRRRRLGFVHQSDNLLPFLSVVENVSFQLSLGAGPVGPDRASELLDQLGLRAEADKLPDHLSGGQRQRAAVARAVVHRPELILADEPAGALDATNAAGVMDLLISEQRAIGATLVLVTHDRQAAGRLDNQVELRDGRIRIR